MKIKEKWVGTALLVTVTLSTVTCASTGNGPPCPCDDKHSPEKTHAAMPTASPAFLSQNPASIADVSERAIPSVVNISSTKTVRTQNTPFGSPFFSDPFFKHFFEDFRGFQFKGQPRERLERSLGSGVIVGEDGIIITNNHVVAKANEIQVTLSDKREFKAEVVGTDPPSDLAVLRLKDAPDDLKTISFGDSGSLRLGEVVIAIGNPFGVGQTVTMGIVSAKGRANVGIVDYEDFIQTDAAINPGNSGGALLNLKGELVGINTAILSRSGGYQGIGFAIPSNMAKSIMGSLVKNGKVVRGFLGVMIQDLTPQLAKALKIKDAKGVLVSDVVPNGPADKAGLEPQDVILSVNNEKVNSSSRLRNLIASVGAGNEVALEVVRDGDTKEYRVKLEEKSGDAEGETTIDEDEGPLGGISVATLSDELRERFDVSDRIRQGVVVSQVQSGTSAARAGLRAGDVILEINRNKVKSVKSFRSLYKKAKGSVLLRIHRQGSSMFLVLNNK